MTSTVIADSEKVGFDEAEANSNLSAQPETTLGSETKLDATNNALALNDNVVDFDGLDDPYRPLNWPMGKKLLNTILYALCTFCATWGSTM